MLRLYPVELFKFKTALDLRVTIMMMFGSFLSFFNSQILLAWSIGFMSKGLLFYSSFFFFQAQPCVNLFSFYPITFGREHPIQNVSCFTNVHFQELWVFAWQTIQCLLLHFQISLKEQYVVNLWTKTSSCTLLQKRIKRFYSQSWFYISGQLASR